MADRWAMEGLVLIDEGRVVEEELVLMDEVVDEGEGGRRYWWFEMALGVSLDAIFDKQMVEGLVKEFRLDCTLRRRGVVFLPRLSRNLTYFLLSSPGGRCQIRVIEKETKSSQ